MTLRIGQRISHDGQRWEVRQLYRADQKILIRRDGELRMCDWPAGQAQRTASRPSISSRPAVCAACGREFKRAGNHQKYCRRTDCLCVECGERPIEARSLCKPCLRTPNRWGSEDHRAIMRDHWIDQHGDPYWTRERVIRALQKWADRHDGRAPACNAWDKGRRDYDPALLLKRTDRPSRKTVESLFGSWKAGVEAAGLTPYAKVPIVVCKRGHDLTDPENVYLFANGTQRHCRTCQLTAYGRLSSKDKTARRARVTEKRQLLRQDTLAAYGTECAECGSTDALQLVYIDPSDRSRLSDERGEGWDFYRWLRDHGYPNDPPLTVLCKAHATSKHGRYRHLLQVAERVAEGRVCVVCDSAIPVERAGHHAVLTCSLSCKRKRDRQRRDEQRRAA